MLRCDSCGLMFDEYYRMPDGKHFCCECWRDGRNIAEMRAIQVSNQRMQVERDRAAFEQKRKADEVRLGQLEHAIKLEKDRYKSAWSIFESTGYISDRPFNYEEVQLLERQRRDLEKHLEDNPYYRFPRVTPIPNNSSFPNNTDYFNKAKPISKDKSHYYETVILPREKEEIRKAEAKRLKEQQDRLEAEREAREREKLKRKAQEEAIARRKAELKPFEDSLLRRESLPLQIRIRLAKETYREEVMMKCAKDFAKSVRDSLRTNPNITTKVLSELYRRENPVNPVVTKADQTAKTEDKGCLWFIIIVGVLGALLSYLSGEAWF